ncbi:MAG: signal recognition particle-docking protein FtsY [Thermodesulfobacteriota bacterium]|nr:signal recognition particle-docking protein FtsY [Thermodesulfobacteriota bacterium]
MLGWFKKKLKKLGLGKKKEEVPSPEEITQVVQETGAEPEAPSIETDKAEEPVESEPEVTPDAVSPPEEVKVEEDEVQPYTEEPEAVQEEPVESEPEVVTPDAVSPPEEVEVVEDEVQPDAEEPEAVQEEPAVGKSMFQRLREGLSKTRDSFVRRVDELFLGKRVIDDELLDDLEEILITADLGVRTARDLIDEARTRVARKELSDPAALKDAIKERILSYLLNADKPAELVMPESGPFVIMVVGVNGVGKTTTIGKMAHKFVNSGQSVLLVAGDTFRAAAVEQLQILGERVGVNVVSQESGADPSSVVYDAIDFATNRDFDVIIMDTAGRLHTKVNLMEELKKIKRVIGKKLPGAPHEVMLVLDATTGQNGISQARLFCEAVDITGITLTKLDGTAKGGIVVNVCHEFSIPIRFIGIGEKMEDLRDFDPNEFVDALFEVQGNDSKFDS